MTHPERSADGHPTDRRPPGRRPDDEGRQLVVDDLDQRRRVADADPTDPTGEATPTRDDLPQAEPGST